jgi:hypothetical protein
VVGTLRSKPPAEPREDGEHQPGRRRLTTGRWGADRRGRVVAANEVAISGNSWSWPAKPIVAHPSSLRHIRAHRGRRDRRQCRLKELATPTVQGAPRAGDTGVAPAGSHRGEEAQASWPMALAAERAWLEGRRCPRREGERAGSGGRRSHRPTPSATASKSSRGRFPPIHHAGAETL